MYCEQEEVVENGRNTVLLQVVSHLPNSTVKPVQTGSRARSVRDMWIIPNYEIVLIFYKRLFLYF